MLQKHREDIDGLRALAVIPVILFHASFELFSGGYVGVDIFFVISGYLITNILINNLNENKFSITNFYERRIRRIFPALLLVLVVCVLFSFFLMLPAEFKRFKHSLISSLFFYTNYFFMFDVGYFADAAETKPLLHIWSLAVEEQFYVVFPIYLYLAYKYVKKYLGVLTFILLVISFVYSFLLVNSAPSDAFYSTPSRAWELLTGSMLAIYPSRRIFRNKYLANSCSFTGLILIVYAILFFDSATQFPGASALYPVMGSALILLSANSEGNFVGILLSSNIFRFFGLISYSLYLWHWPVLTYARIYSLGSDPHELMPYLIVIMVLLAFLSWKFIETPFRKAMLINSKSALRLNRFSVSILVFFIVLSGIAFSNINKKSYRTYSNHVESRLKDNPYKLDQCEWFKGTGSNLKICYFGNLKANQVSFALVGDSHGEALLPGFYESAKKHKKKGIFIGSGGCLGLFGVSRPQQGFNLCKPRMDTFAEYLKVADGIETVFLASRWATYISGERYKNRLGSDIYITDDESEEISKLENKLVFERAFDRTIKLLNEIGKSVVVVTQVPETEYGTWDIVRAKYLGLNLEFRPPILDYFERQKVALETFNLYATNNKIKIIELHKYMCGLEYCEVFNDKGKYIYTDNNHITKQFSVTLSTLFEKYFE